MKKTTYIILLSVVITSLSVYAACPTSWLAAHTHAYFKLEESGFNYSDETSNDYNFTSGNTPDQDAVDSMIGNSQDFNKANSDYIYTATDEAHELTTMAWSGWIYFDEETTNQVIFAHGADYDSTPNYFGVICYIVRSNHATLANKMICWSSDGDQTKDHWTTNALTTGNWYHLVYMFNSTTGDATVYIDGSTDGSETAEGTTSLGYESGTDSEMTLGDRIYNDAWVGEYWHGNIDEVAVFDTAISSECITYLYNSGSPGTDQQYPYGSNVSTMTVTHISPANNTQNNSNLVTQYNVTHEANCSIYINSTLNTTSNNVAANTTLNFTVNMSSDGDYLFYTNCTRSDGLNDTTGTYTYTYDGTQPFITFNFPLNNSRFNTSRVLNLSIYTTDDYLLDANLTITHSNGSVMYNNYSGNISGWTRYDWNTSINMENWSNAEYLVFAEAWDGHTQQYFRPAKKVNKDQEQRRLSYKFPDDHINVTLIDGNKLGQYEGINTTKLEDRYTFEFMYKSELKPNTRMTFRISAKQRIRHMKGSPYDPHFIIGRKYWLDFVGPEGNYAVTKVDHNTYDIELTTGKKQKKFIFESLGGLNYNNKSVRIQLQNNVTFYLNDTGVGTLLDNFSVTTVYENSGFITQTKHTNGSNVSFWVDANIPVSWNASKPNYVIPSGTIQNVGATPYTQIMNGSSAGVTLNFYDEANETTINDRTISIELVGNSSYEYTTTTGIKTITGIASGNYEIRYEADGYYSRTYYATLNVTTLQTINLYLCHTSDCDRVIHTVYDQDSVVAPNITIELQRFYASTNSFTIVGMARTNFEGRAALYVELYDTFYKIIYKDVTGRIIVDTDPSPFFETETIDLIPIREAEFYSWTLYDDVWYNLSYLNSSGTIYARLVYSDSNNLVRSMCLEVQRITATGIYDICNNCTSSASATITCVINENHTGQYKASALLDTSTSSSWYTLAVTWFNKFSNTPRFGRTGIFYTAMIVTTMAMIGIGSVVGSIVLMVLGLIGAVIAGFATGFNAGLLYYFILLGFIVIFIVRKSTQ